ncbi:MAG: hypothetical protein NTX07_08040 [Solirubrobacterales bacterium]|nr:hypothetical protein [Solirubrobacterales bacterium]
MDSFDHRDDELLEGELVEITSRRAAVVQRAHSLAPVAKAAAVATVGAAAGALTAAAVARVNSHSPQRRLNGRRKADRLPAIESTTSILIDIHRLAER